MLTKFEIKDCPPPPYRPDHELRVVMREAIPRLLTEQLPPGTVHFDAGVTDVTTTPTGNRALAFFTCSNPAGIDVREFEAEAGQHCQTSSSFVPL